MYVISRPNLIIIKHHHKCSEKEDPEVEHEKEEEDDGADFFSSADFKKYIENNGYHFTEPLAEFAVKSMYSSKWTLPQVAQYLKSQNLDLESTTHKVTLADIYYGANMYYSDFFPDAITSEPKCITAAMLIANDKDGYEGQLFSRWLSDLMRKKVKVDWGLYY